VTSIATYHIRHATSDDTNDVIGLRVHAETWLRQAGIEQWTVRATGERNIRHSIESDTAYVITTVTGEVVGSLTLDAADPAFWTPSEVADPALYLYKFMILTRWRGTGLGDVLLDWCCARAEMSGALYLRLDCWRTNAGLHRYYRDRGFRWVDMRYAPGRQSGALFERAAGVRTAAPDGMPRLIDATWDG